MFGAQQLGPMFGAGPQAAPSFGAGGGMFGASGPGQQAPPTFGGFGSAQTAPAAPYAAAPGMAGGPAGGGGFSMGAATTDLAGRRKLKAKRVGSRR